MVAQIVTKEWARDDAEQSPSDNTKASEECRVAEAFLMEYYNKLNSDPRELRTLYLPEAEINWSGKQAASDVIIQSGLEDISSYFMGPTANLFRGSRTVVDALHPQPSATSSMGVTVFAKGKMWLSIEPNCPRSTSSINAPEDQQLYPYLFDHFVSLCAIPKTNNSKLSDGVIYKIANEFLHFPTLTINASCPPLSEPAPESNAVFAQKSSSNNPELQPTSFHPISSGSDKKHEKKNPEVFRDRGNAGSHGNYGNNNINSNQPRDPRPRQFQKTLDQQTMFVRKYNDLETLKVVVSAALQDIGLPNEKPDFRTDRSNNSFVQFSAPEVVVKMLTHGVKVDGQDLDVSTAMSNRNKNYFPRSSTTHSNVYMPRGNDCPPVSNEPVSETTLNSSRGGSKPQSEGFEAGTPYPPRNQSGYRNYGGFRGNRRGHMLQGRRNAGQPDRQQRPADFQ